MGTRSRIAAKQADGAFKSIYVHWDGYLQHVGVTLLEHYTDDAKVNELIELGDLSSLGSEIGEKHDFDDRTHRDWCCAYGRDRNEVGVGPVVSATEDDLRVLTRSCGGEYLYVWSDSAWSVGIGGIAFFGAPADRFPGPLQPLSAAIEADKAEA